MCSKPVNDPFGDADAFRTVDAAQRTIDRLEQSFATGDGKSGYFLSTIFGGLIVDNPDVARYLAGFKKLELQYAERAFPILLAEAEAGDPYSMHLVAIYYQTGYPPVTPDSHLSEKWKQKAISHGFHPGQ